MQGIGYQQVKNTAWQGGGFKSVRAPYDALLAFQGRTAAIDAKSFDKHTMHFSDLTEHQVIALEYLWQFGVPAGYVVWFRTINQVVFFGALMLKDMKAKDSLISEDGIILGDIDSMDLRLIFRTNGSKFGIK